MILVAHNQTLGHLRNAIQPLSKNGLQISEVPKDLSKLSAKDLHEHLAKEALLPKRRRLLS
jgi:protein required for attachment to host cells